MHHGVTRFHFQRERRNKIRHGNQLTNKCGERQWADAKKDSSETQPLLRGSKDSGVRPRSAPLVFLKKLL